MSSCLLQMTGRGSGWRGSAGAVRCFTGARTRCSGWRRGAVRGGRVTDLARLSLVPEFGRGHGALYDALNAGRVDIGRVRLAVAGLPLPAWPDGRIRLAVDVCGWLRPDAAASPERMFCHVHGRGEERGADDPGVAVLVRGRAGAGGVVVALLLDAVRIGPDDDETEVTAAQLREVVGRLVAAGRWRPGDPDIIVVMDAGYDRAAGLAAGGPAGPVRAAAGRAGPLPARRRPGRPLPGRPPSTPGPRSGAADQAPGSDGAAVTAGRDQPGGRPGHRLAPDAPQAAARAAWASPPRELPVIEGTLIRLAVTTCPATSEPKPCGCGHRTRPRPPARAPLLAGVPAPLRHRALLPVPQAGARLDRPAAARPRRRRPVDLAGHRRLHDQLRLARPWPPPSACPGSPPARRQMTPGRVRPAFRTATQTAATPPARRNPQARPRPPARLEEPASGPPPRRGQDHQQEEKQQEGEEDRAGPDRLNNKLRACLGN